MQSNPILMLDWAPNEIRLPASRVSYTPTVVPQLFLFPHLLSSLLGWARLPI